MFVYGTEYAHSSFVKLRVQAGEINRMRCCGQYTCWVNDNDPNPKKLPEVSSRALVTSIAPLYLPYAASRCIANANWWSIAHTRFLRIYLTYLAPPYCVRTTLGHGCSRSVFPSCDSVYIRVSCLVVRCWEHTIPSACGQFSDVPLVPSALTPDDSVVDLGALPLLPFTTPCIAHMMCIQRPR